MHLFRLRQSAAFILQHCLGTAIRFSVMDLMNLVDETSQGNMKAIRKPHAISAANAVSRQNAMK